MFNFFICSSQHYPDIMIFELKNKVSEACRALKKTFILYKIIGL